MAKNSKIEWTDHTVNLWWGCSKMHTGCKNCYAESLSNRYGNDIWGDNKPRKMIKSAFTDLIKFQKAAEVQNKKVKIFCGSMMDIFEPDKPLLNPTEYFKTTGDLRAELMRKIDIGYYPNLIFLFLTKRPSYIASRIPAGWYGNPPKNVWFGTSISDQKTADELIPKLTMFNANLFLSIEPQVGAIDRIDLTFINWVIQGGESGNKKRPFKEEWAEKIKQKCIGHFGCSTPYFFKQIDKVRPIPEHLNIKQFPEF